MMRMRTLLVLLLAAAVLAGPGRGRPRVVHLKDGTKVIGRIVEDECTEDVLVLRDIRTRAKRKVPWSDIKPELAQALKVQLGFAVASPGEASAIQGVRIVNRAGSAFQGLLTNAKTAERDGYYLLKTSDGERRIRLRDVKSGPDPVQLDPLDVYTPQEAYEEALKEKKPETAEDHFRLAELARMYGALDAAKHHLEMVLAVDDGEDPKYQKDKIQRQLDHVNKLLADKGALDELLQIRKSIVYKRYKQAAEAIRAFREKHEGKEVLLETATRLEEELKKKRSKHFIDQVPRLLRNTIKELLLTKVKEKGITLRQAQQYAIPQGRRREFLKGVRGGGLNDPTIETSASADALTIVSEKLGITPDEAEAFWDKRPKRSWHSAFYRDGTFIVVEELEDALAKAPKIKFKKGSKKPKLPKPKKQKTPEGWWEGKIKQRKFSDLRDWLYAWWAEKSGLCEVLEPKLEICPTCHGKGYLPKIMTTSEGSIPWYDRCPTCHMAKHLRVVRFK
jgi:tetratricopeptide (TPR) repeat protein